MNHQQEDDLDVIDRLIDRGKLQLSGDRAEIVRFARLGARLRASSAKPPKSAPSCRAHRPDATRLHGPAVWIGGSLLVLMVAGALIYAFVVAPWMTPRMTAEKAPPSAQAQAQPSTVIAGAAAAYVHPVGAVVAALQAPRIGPGGAPIDAQTTRAATTTASTPLPAAPVVTSTLGAPSAVREARRSGLVFSNECERRTAPQPTSGDLSAAGPVTSGPLSAQAAADYDAAYGRHVLIAPRSPLEVIAGTLIPAALLTMVDIGRPGPVAAVTTEPVSMPAWSRPTTTMAWT